MNLYDPDGEFDPELARDELLATLAVSNRDAARRDVAVIQTAALIDVASSLKVLALEAAFAMPRLLDTELGGDVETAEGVVEARVFAVVAGFEGQRVRPIGTAGGEMEGTTTGSYGTDQGTVWVGVRWDYADDGVSEARVFIHELEGVTAVSLTELADDVPRVGIATEAESPALLADDDGDGEPAVGGYEAESPEVEADSIDDDFEPIEGQDVTSALAALKARSKAKGKGKGK